MWLVFTEDDGLTAAEIRAITAALGHNPKFPTAPSNSMMATKNSPFTACSCATTTGTMWW